MGDEQASRLEGLLQSSATRVPIVLLQRVEEIIPAVRESLKCMDVMKSEPGPCTGTYQISSGDGNQVTGKKGEEVTDIKEEEDPWPAASMRIKTEPANCLDVLRGEQESCSETCSASSGDGKQFVFVNVDDDTVRKQQEDPEPTTSTALKNDPVVIMGNEQASRLEGLLQSSTPRVPIVLLQRVEEIIPAVRESLKCMRILRSDPDPRTGTCQMSSDDGNQFIANKGEVAADIKVEEDPWPATYTGIKTEPANCLDVLRGEQESCTETCSASSGDGKQFVFINVGDDTIRKQQEDPEPTTPTAIKNDPVNCVNLLRSDCGSCRETSLMSLDDEKWGVGIKGEEVTDTEEELNPQPKALQTIKTEPEITVNGQLGTCSGKCATFSNACNKASVHQTDLVTHKQVHAGERPFVCEVCKKAFVRHGDLMKHKRIHSGERPFSCDVCHKAFFACVNLKNHKRIHSGERPFSCDVCNKAFIQKGHLMTHKLIHSGLRPFPCEVCKKAFVRQGDLMKHKRIHTGERPFVCDVCDMTFIWKKSLVQHKWMHSADNPFLCDVCKKTFISESSLVKHKHVHSGERPFSCDICNKAFILKGHLMTHKLIHSGLRPFSCDVCHKAFSSCVNLMNHKRIHSGERPFFCDVCGRAFIWKKSLVQHKRMHSANKTFLMT